MSPDYEMMLTVT